MISDDTARLIWQRYEDGVSYQSTSGLRRMIPEYVRFYEGKQWPEPTRNTKNLPRPVINIVKMICRMKKSSILSTPVKITYKCHDKRVDMKTFNAFSDFILKSIDQDAIDKSAMDDGVKKGSYFYHYYWDSDASESGELGCELIDPLSIFFENPCELNEQKQKWIIISQRMSVEEAIKNAEEGVDISLITPDNEDGFSGNEGRSKLCTVLTMYYRVNGEVHCVRSVKNTVIKREFSITPRNDGMRSSLGMEGGSKNIATLYPIVCGYYEKRDRCIYGLSEVEGLIPNQKAINFNIAMSLLNAQEVAWGKYIALPGALKGQVISNSPGQVLIDYSGTGNGIKRMQDNYMQSFPVELVKTITDLTRSVTGTSEFMTGEISGSGLSGTAIARLQSQALMPIAELRSTFMSVKRKQGRILAQFYKLYYYDKTFFAPEKDGEGDAKLTFFSKNYENAELDVVVESSLGADASVAGDISMLDNVLKSGLISLETYVRSYPDSALTDKKRILAEIEAQRVREQSLALIKEKLIKETKDDRNE